MAKLIVSVVLVLLVAGCSQLSGASMDPDFTADELAQIEDAISTWEELCPEREINPEIVIDCETARARNEFVMGRTVRYFEHTTIYLCLDWPQETRPDLARVVTLHELGHFLGADHAPEEETDSIMRTSVSSWDLPDEPSPEDVKRAGCTP